MNILISFVLALIATVIEACVLKTVKFKTTGDKITSLVIFSMYFLLSMVVI